MRSNFLNFTKMQVSALSQIVWLQLLSIALFPMFFNQINVNNDFANVIIYATGLLIATPLLILFSGITHAIKPEMFAIVQTHILPYGLLLVAVFMPIEFLIFYTFEAQKADIIGALSIFPYTALMALIYNYLMNSPLWIAVFIIAIFTNVFCYRFSNKLYKSKGL